MTKDTNTAESKSIKELLHNYWFLDEAEAELVRIVARVKFNEKYGG